jgi:hypothetical protein
MTIKLGGGGGVSVPIGGKLDLLDTSNTVTKGGEVFLRTGLTASSSTYPDAPVKSFISTGTLANHSDYGASLSPWQGVSTVYQNHGGGMADTGTQEMFSVTSNGWVNKFSSYGTTFVASRNLRDGTVFPTTSTASQISCVAYGMTSRALASNLPASDVRAFFSGNGGTNQVPAIAYLSNDLQTHYGTFDITDYGTGSGWPPNRDYVKAIFLNINGTDRIVVLHQGQAQSSTTYEVTYAVPSLNNSSGELTEITSKTLFTAPLNGEWWRNPEVWPNVLSGSSQATYRYEIKVRPSSSYSNQVFAVYDPRYNYLISTFSYDINNLDNTNNYNYRAPFVHGTHALMFQRRSQTQPFAGKYSGVSTTISFDAQFFATGYRGYAFKDASTIYIGHTNENKIFAIHPTTKALGAAISTSSQATPYRLAYHNNVLYNLNGTNIHTYSTTSNAFVSTIDISNKVSGTNAVGIAHDGTNLYVLDGSNSKIHKYNATGSSYVSFVTLSDTPHTSSTLVSLAVDSTNNVFLVTDTSNCSMYALDGTAKGASVSAGWEDSEVHNGHLVGMQTNSSTTTKIPTPDVVGNPSGSLGSVSTTYYRVS